MPEDPTLSGSAEQPTRSADASRVAEFRTIAFDEALLALMVRYPDRSLSTRYERELAIAVDPVRARFGSWYEFFPRSASPISGQHGTFSDCEAWIPYVARMGFDVIYFPPIHPIGVTFRKGKNNSVIVEPADVGSPWAIGGEEGGHKSIHPDLGTLDQFRACAQGKGARHRDCAGYRFSSLS